MPPLKTDALALRTCYSLGDLEDGLVRVEEINRSLDGTDGSHALAAGFKAGSGDQSGWSGARGSRDGGGDRRKRSKRDGKDRPPKDQSQQQQHQPQQQQKQQCQPQQQQKHDPRWDWSYDLRPPPPSRELITIGGRRKLKRICRKHGCYSHGYTDEGITLIGVVYVPGLGTRCIPSRKHIS